MTAYAYTRGHKIEWDEANEIWRYADTGECVPFDGFGGDRQCAYCHRMPTPEGHDACLGELPGVRYACCGHGVEHEGGAFQGYIRYERLPFWLTNKNRWPIAIAILGGLPLVSMTAWILYSLAFVPDFVVEDVFGWWMGTYAVTAVCQAIAHWIRHMQTNTANLLRRARQQAFVASAISDVMSQIEDGTSLEIKYLNTNGSPVHLAGKLKQTGDFYEIEVEE